MGYVGGCGRSRGEGGRHSVRSPEDVGGTSSGENKISTNVRRCRIG